MFTYTFFAIFSGFLIYMVAAENGNISARTKTNESGKDKSSPQIILNSEAPVPEEILKGAQKLDAKENASSQKIVQNAQQPNKLQSTETEGMSTDASKAHTSESIKSLENISLSIGESISFNRTTANLPNNATENVSQSDLHSNGGTTPNNSQNEQNTSGIKEDEELR